MVAHVWSSVGGPLCFRLNLECPLKIRVLRTWSSACGAAGDVETLKAEVQWEEVRSLGSVPFKGTLGPQSLPLFVTRR